MGYGVVSAHLDREDKTPQEPYLESAGEKGARKAKKTQTEFAQRKTQTEFAQTKKDANRNLRKENI